MYKPLEYLRQISTLPVAVMCKHSLLLRTDVPDFSKASINFDDVSPNEVSMSWQAPTEDGGSPIRNYIIERSIAGKNKWDKVKTVAKIFEALRTPLSKNTCCESWFAKHSLMRVARCNLGLAMDNLSSRKFTRSRLSYK